jgi:hypothetical protein
LPASSAVVAGIPVRADSILEPARLVDDPELERAYGRDAEILALDMPERETILLALDEPPSGLEELRAVLLQEHVWREREGL